VFDKRLVENFFLLLATRVEPPNVILATTSSGIQRISPTPEQYLVEFWYRRKLPSPLESKPKTKVSALEVLLSSLPGYKNSALPKAPSHIEELTLLGQAVHEKKKILFGETPRQEYSPDWDKMKLKRQLLEVGDLVLLAKVFPSLSSCVHASSY